MIQEYIIRPIGTDARYSVDGLQKFGRSNAIQLTGSFRSRPGYTMIATEEFAFGEYKDSDHQQKSRTEGGTPMPEPRDIYFDKTRPEAAFRFDTESEDQYDIDVRKMVEDFWMRHPLVGYKGKKMTNVPLFELISRKEVVNDQYLNVKTSLAVSNKIMGMDLNELRDVWYYYGLEPKGKSLETLSTTLIDPKNGHAVLDGENFLKVFAQETNTERDYNINVRKAIMLGIIQNRQVAGRDNFYLNDEFIGISYDDVLRYCKEQDRTYKEHILRKIALLEEKAHGKTEIKPEDVGGKPAEKPKAKTPSLI